MVGKIFADFGAKVFKIEHPTKEDSSKTLGKDQSYYEFLNSNKSVLKLDLNASGDRKTFETYLKTSDLVIEGFKEDTKIKLGLTLSHLQFINPRISLLSIKGYPPGSSRKDWPGHDLNFQGASGLIDYLGYGVSMPLAQQFTSQRAAFLALSTLEHLRLSPYEQGKQIEINLVDSLRDAFSLQINELKVTGVKSTLFTQYPASYRLYRTKDGQITVAAVEVKYWESFLEGIGKLHLIDKQLSKDPKIIGEIQSVLIDHPTSYWMELFSQNPCCVDQVRGVLDPLD